MFIKNISNLVLHSGTNPRSPICLPINIFNGQFRTSWALPVRPVTILRVATNFKGAHIAFHLPICTKKISDIQSSETGR